MKLFTPSPYTTSRRVNHIMGLKSIKLCNFKSYKHETEIPLTDLKLIGIIGPNGSGKSNLLDALCFVMGMNVEQLRCRSLQDFVCIEGDPNEETYVEVTVSNSNNELEATFKRTIDKLYCNGNPLSLDDYLSKWEEFQIMSGGKNCVVLQGDITSLAGSTPGDLAAYIESNAVGDKNDIKLYTELKAQLEQSAAESRSNVTSRNAAQARVDQAKEIRNSKEKLKTTKEQLLKLRARRRVLASKEKQATLAGLKKRVEDAREQLRVSIEESTSLNEETNVLRSEHARKRKALQTARHAEREIQQVINTAEENLTPLKKRQQGLDTQLEVLGPEIEFAKQSSESNKAEKQALLKSINLVKRSLEREKARMSELSGNGISSDLKELWNKLNDEFLQETNESQQTLKKLRNDLRFRQSQRDLALEDLEGRQNDLSDTQSKLKQLDLEKQQLLAHIESSENELQDYKNELESVANELSELKSSQKSMGDKLKEHTHFIKRADGSKRALAYRHSIIDSVDRFKTLSDDVYDLLSSLVEPIDSEFNVALNRALGSNNDALVVKDTKTALECIKKARSESMGRFKFLPVSDLEVVDLSITRASLARVPLSREYGARVLVDCVKIDPLYRPALVFALSNTVYVPTVAQALELRSNNLKMRMITGSGVVLSANGIVTASSEVVNTSSLSERSVVLAQRKAQQLAEKLKSSVSQEQELHNRETRLSQKVLSIQNRILQSKDELKMFDVRSENMSKDIANIEQYVDLYSQRYNTTTDAYKAAQEKFDAFNNEILHLRSEKFTSFTSQVNGELRDWDSVFSGASERQANFHRELQKLESKLADLEIKCQSSENYFQKLNERCEIIKEALNLIVVEVNKLESQLSTEYTKLERVNSRVRAAQAELDAKSDEIGASDIAVDEARQRVKEIEAEEHKRMLALTAELGVSEESDAILEDESTTRKRKRTGSSHTDFADIERDILSLDKIDRNISSLEKELERLQSLVSFNMENTEDEDLSSQQVDDLAVSIAEARNSYDETLAKFSEVKTRRVAKFEDILRKVELELDQCYKELVGDEGKAELSIIDDGEPFSGLSFTVLPPGKTFTNIYDLSGGERTMAALALLLACQKLVPAPFIILDEIDAALDFANVASVASYLRNHCDSTQFIVVSLKQRLFQHANNLVGVYKLDSNSKVLTVAL